MLFFIYRLSFYCVWKILPRNTYFRNIVLIIEHVMTSVAEWFGRLALKLLAPLRWGSNPMRGSCQLLTEGCWFTSGNNQFLQLWKLTAICNRNVA